jgi:hypothetical protein
MGFRATSRRVIVAFTATGCATMVHGTRQTVEITSTPPGSTATIQPGDKTLVTPGSATLERKGAYVVRVTHDGYRPANGYIDRDVSGARWGNIGFGGVIGLLIDQENGAAYELTPDPLDVRLEPLEAPAPATE